MPLSNLRSKQGRTGRRLNDNEGREAYIPSTTRVERERSTSASVDHEDSGASETDVNTNLDPGRHGLPSSDRKVERHPRYRPLITIDWRAEICRLVDRSTEISNEDLFEALEEASEKLKEVDRLRAMAKKQTGPPRAQVIHRVYCHYPLDEVKLYLEAPWVVETGPYNAHLRGSQTIDNLDLYLERNKEVVFIVYKVYQCCEKPPNALRQSQLRKDLGIDASAFLQEEYISLIAPELSAVLSEVANAVVDLPHPFLDNFEEDDYEEDISHPYLWYFHRRNEICQAIEDLPSDVRIYANCFRDYIQDRMGDEWHDVDKLLGQKRISAEYIDYLFVPGQINISQAHGTSLSRLQGLVADKWMKTNFPRHEFHNDGFTGILSVSSWSFDGTFRKSLTSIPLGVLPSHSKDFSIFDLPIYPIQFASDEVVKAIRNRGKMFWRCRFRNYVSYSSEGDGGIYNTVDTRYMVDIGTYNSMHRSNTARDQADFQFNDSENDLPSEYMSQDDPDLQDDFFMCLPSSISGFHMLKKQWVTLDVHYMKDVVWNKEAFDYLVIDPETKAIIRAVVSNQLRATENTDLIAGKGNGLFILLHGGPGTGKTLTAESVAEIAQRPLYRVTCGDIGTKAEDVEKYLEAVLALGKTWGCVVLLDEADVFLEQRSLVNLERNALVSVFLRVLEYNDGILILTSNRVGIFDEAFKSRIQLNLRYKNLDQDQRLEIWKNFLERLKRIEGRRLSGETEVSQALGFGINMKEIEDRIEDLARVELNGRQIRNAISTARELAMYQEKPMGYQHIRAVIKEAEKFEEYLYELREHFTEDEVRRDKGERILRIVRA